MPDLILGILRPTDPAKVLETAARALGVDPTAAIRGLPPAHSGLECHMRGMSYCQNEPHCSEAGECVLYLAIGARHVAHAPQATVMQTIETLRDVMHRHSFNRRMRDAGPEWFSFRVDADGKAVDIEVHRNRTQARGNADRLNLLEVFRVLRDADVGLDALIACASHLQSDMNPA